MLNAFYAYNENKMGKELYFVAGADQLLHKSIMIKCCFSNYEFYLELFTKDELEVCFLYIFLEGTQFSSGLRYIQALLGCFCGGRQCTLST